MHQTDCPLWTDGQVKECFFFPLDEQHEKLGLEALRRYVPWGSVNVCFLVDVAADLGAGAE